MNLDYIDSCYKIWDQKEQELELDENYANEQLVAFQKYKNIIRVNPKSNVWWDRISDCAFGSEQTFYNSSNDFNFWSWPEHFITDKNPIWGIQHVIDYLLKATNIDFDQNSELIISQDKKWEEIKNKKVLIIGAGPSLDQNIDFNKYDIIITCNNFFKNSLFGEIKPHFVVLGPEVDINSTEFMDYMIRYNPPRIILEAGTSPFKNKEEIDHLSALIDQPMLYYHTRYFSKLGVGVRLIALATLLGAESVSFVGVDGFPIGYKHMFEGENKIHVGAPLVKDALNIYRRQTLIFWEYMSQIKQNVRLYNLGANFNGNEHTKYTNYIKI